MKTLVPFSLLQINQSNELAQAFKYRFDANYDFLFNMQDNIVGVKQALSVGINHIRNTEEYRLIKEILGQDCITNRELKALAYTLKEFGIADF